MRNKLAYFEFVRNKLAYFEFVRNKLAYFEFVRNKLAYVDITLSHNLIAQSLNVTSIDSDKKHGTILLVVPA